MVCCETGETYRRHVWILYDPSCCFVSVVWCSVFADADCVMVLMQCAGDQIRQFVDGYSGAEFKSFRAEADAQAYIGSSPNPSDQENTVLHLTESNRAKQGSALQLFICDPCSRIAVRHSLLARLVVPLAAAAGMFIIIRML